VGLACLIIVVDVSRGRMRFLGFVIGVGWE
jgi:hypothetical protein